jgi:hypothetical protein
MGFRVDVHDDSHCTVESRGYLTTARFHFGFASVSLLHREPRISFAPFMVLKKNSSAGFSFL